MKICYFGIYDPEFGRNKVYISGLKKNGVEIVECRDNSRGILKYFKLWRRHRAIVRAGGYDVLIVGYPGHIVVPFAKFLSKKPVIFDALCTLYEGEIVSRDKYRWNLIMRGWVNLIDHAAVLTADLIFVETNAQREFFIKRFSLPPKKISRIFTGVDEEIFHLYPEVKKKNRFTAVFRGKFLPEAGVAHIIQAAKILENQDVDFLILGHGFLENEVRSLIEKTKAKNIEWVSEKLSFAELVKRMSECHVLLGQFEKHERLERTIPHKAFEALALGLPYVTARARGISELLTDGKDCFMVGPANSNEIADKLIFMKNNRNLLENISRNGLHLFQEKLTSAKLAEDIVEVIARIKKN